MTKSDFKTILKKYTPAFIVDNDIFDALIDAVAGSLLTVYNFLDGLADANWTGKGLLKNAEENQVIFKNDDSEASIQTKLTNRYSDHKVRGTEDRILPEVKDILDDPLADVTFYESDNCGIIVDVTYIGIDVQAIINVNKLVDIDYHVSIISDAELELYSEFIRHKIVPLDVEIIYTEK